MRKTISILLALALVLSFSLVATTPVAAATLKVGPGETYTTIQAAVTAANPGDTIEVAAGTYNENLVVSKSVTLIGENREATIIDGGGTGKVVTIQADYVSVTGFTIRNSGSSSSRPFDAGIYLYYADHCSISNTVITNNFDGFYFEWSHYNTIQNSVVSHSSQIGINIGDRSSTHNKVLNSSIHSNGSGIQAMSSSHYTEIADVEMYNNAGNGVRIGWSQHWVIRDSSFYDSGNGISIDTASNGIVTNCDIYSNTRGIHFGGWGPYYNTISNNKVHSNQYGISLFCQARYNVVKENAIFNNDYGVYITRHGSHPCYDNHIYHNSFINNTLNAKDDEDRYTNYWDGGYPSGGNYWSDYTGVDLYSGSAQNEPGSDGIGDTPYAVDSSGSDGYPLMEPIDTHMTQCAESSTGTGEVCLTTSHGIMVDLTAVPAISPAPRGVTFPHGMFEFEVTGLAAGQTITLTIELPAAVPVGTVWWKYDNGRWYSLPNLDDNGNSTMKIRLTDGGTGDSDSIPGQITDPGGPGNPLTVGWDGSPVSKSAVLWPLFVLLAAMVAGVSLLVWRRRRSEV